MCCVPLFRFWSKIQHIPGLRRRYPVTASHRRATIPYPPETRPSCRRRRDLVSVDALLPPPTRPCLSRDAAVDADKEDVAAPTTASTLPYTKDLVRGDLCAFTTGYFVFLAETEASVRSLQHFMPGVRVRVAVDPVYFSVFNRYAGGGREVGGNE